jgi:group I intron endonuclease
MKIYTIYKSTNKNNQKSYIGFDSNWPKRKNKHKQLFSKKNTKFYSAIKKYGWDSFEWTILYQSKDKNHTLNEMENFFMIFWLPS